MKGRSSWEDVAPEYVSYLNVRGSVVGKFETFCRWQCSWACRTPEGSIGDAGWWHSAMGDSVLLATGIAPGEKR